MFLHVFNHGYFSEIISEIKLSNHVKILILSIGVMILFNQTWTQTTLSSIKHFYIRRAANMQWEVKITDPNIPRS